jgi:hypothetical protein
LPNRLPLAGVEVLNGFVDGETGGSELLSSSSSLGAGAGADPLVRTGLPPVNRERRLMDKGCQLWGTPAPCGYKKGSNGGGERGGDDEKNPKITLCDIVTIAIFPSSDPIHHARPEDKNHG